MLRLRLFATDKRIFVSEHHNLLSMCSSAWLSESLGLVYKQLLYLRCLPRHSRKYSVGTYDKGGTGKELRLSVLKVPSEAQQEVLCGHLQQRWDRQGVEATMISSALICAHLLCTHALSVLCAFVLCIHCTCALQGWGTSAHESVHMR